MSHVTLSDWFASPLGASLMANELDTLDTVLGDIFGFHAVQVGLTRLPLLRASRIPHRMTVAALEPADVNALAQELPFATQSIDLVLLPHVLEFSESPHAILREVDRVLVPEGRLVITGFNPWSLWGIWQSLDWSRNEHPWNGEFISLPRLKDWLSLLDLEVNAGKLWAYGLPIQHEGWRRRFQFLEAAGDRWWGIAGGVYMVEAIKRVPGMRLVQPKWVGRQQDVMTAAVPTTRWTHG